MATTAPEEVRERVLSYISHQVAKGPDNIRETVQKGHDQLLRLIDGLSEEQATFKPGPDEWSVLEVLRHVIGSKQGIARRTVSLARSEASASFEPEDEAPAFSSLADALSALEAAHRGFLAAVDSLSPEADLEARFDHMFFGPLNCREWAVFQRVHDGDHAGQIEQIKAAPGYPAAA